MVIFRQYISPSTKLKYLVVETEDGVEQTRFSTQTPLAGRYASSWPSLINPLHMANWTSVKTHNSNKLLKLWFLQAPDHHHANIATSLPSLGRRIIQGEIRWGNTIIVEGEYHHIPGYWEWTEDILGRCQETLGISQIYDAVYASLFTYDRNSNILQAFCEAWCPKTNTLLTSIGELSISLWDLHVLGGLPILGSLYEELVPEVKELTGFDEKKTKYLPRTCEYLFAAYHHLRGANQRVSFSQWIEFWCKRPSRYGPAPPRQEEKSSRLELTHNPSGTLPDTKRWSYIEEKVFSKIGVNSNKKDETYLAAFLSCWLCAFVLPNKEGHYIRPGTFKMASLMASGKRVSLAIPVLVSIYNGLNKISTASQLNQITVCFPIHYVYGWLSHYFKTHFAFANGPFVPTMVAYSGEGAARYFDKNDARKHIHGADSVAWSSTMLDKKRIYFYVDNDRAPELETSYFMSIRFNYLPLRCKNSFIIEPYSPHRFSRQFGFYQNIPGIMKNDIRSVSLDKGLIFWRICTMSRSSSRATFPLIMPNAGDSFGSDYQTWWKKTHGNFLSVHLQGLVNAAGSTPVIHLEGSDEVHISKVLDADAGDTLPLGAKVSQQRDKRKSRLLPVAPKAKTSTQATRVLKRPLQYESESSSRDRCWKRTRVCIDENATVPIVELHDETSSPSRTITTPIKEVNQRPTSISCDEVKDTLKSNVRDYPTVAISVLDGKRVVLDAQKNFISSLWTIIREKLSRCNMDSASSLKDEVQLIIKEMKCKDVDISPLIKLLNSFFKSATLYDQARSTLNDMDVEAARKELFLAAGERLSNAMLEEDEKVRVMSSLHQSLGSMRKKIKELCKKAQALEVLLATAKDEVEEAKLATALEVKKFDACSDTDLSDDLGHKKEHLEALRQELINYNLCLD